MLEQIIIIFTIYLWDNFDKKLSLFSEIQYSIYNGTFVFISFTTIYRIKCGY